MGLRGVVCVVAGLASGINAATTARMPDVGSAEGVATGENQTWTLRWFDEFTSSTASIGNSGTFAPRFDGWDGYPPAAFAESNVVVDSNNNNQAWLYARSDTSVTPFFAADSCPCEYRDYTASIIQGSASLPAYGGFVQVDAKLPDAPVRFSIWLQAAGSELSVFDIDVKGGNGSYATTFNTGAHTFDSSTTLASAMETVVVEGGAAELAANFHVYGVAWMRDAVTMYLDGIPQATYVLPGLQSGAAGGYTLNIDVSINPSSLPADVDLPALARVDAVEAWGVTALPNYKQLHGAPVCDPASGGSKRASIRGLVGPDHSLEDCAAGCDDVFDCKYFTIRRTGRCYFFEECDVEIPHNFNAVIFERLVLPEPPEVSPLSGYALQSTADMGSSDGVPRVCNGGLGAGSADRSSLGGSGHDIADCAIACTNQDSCNFFFFTETGFCKMWFSCEASATVPQIGSVLYRKEQYRMVSLQERCDKATNNFRSLGGSGHTREACEIGCEAELACGYYVWYSVSGYCHMFIDSCETLDEAKDGSQFYMRVGGAQLPSVTGWSYVSNQMCDKNEGDNVKASTWSMGGGGHTFLECAATCKAEPTCNFFQRYTSGYCHMWESCPTLRGATRGTLAYSRDVAARMRRGVEDGGETGADTGSDVLVVGAVIMLGVVCAVAVVALFRRAAGRAVETATEVDSVPKVTSRLLA